MTLEDHVALLDTLPGVVGSFMLSGYPSKLYERYRRKHGWHRLDIPIPNNASSKKTKEIKTECLWMNFEPKEVACAPPG